ncbi:peptidase [Enterovibrio norvegicus]|uniref:M14 family metallocarboxypeptidase n=1 Tax=Enterovibrio norvegicus TaxID=188144 RepID=A0ABV4L730_9GAMM|nr:M14 family metallocarboxypeptidase [Enterovibrio norvegicus]OEF57123.1 peptidase [Enterovibrio norvegicus]OEF61044.1 peptidase [Enterovibrio norvegicus]
MSTSNSFPIGTPGQPWGNEEKAQWLATTSIKRSYKDDVLSKIDALRDRFDVTQYGALSIDPARYPQFGIQSRNFDASKPTMLITGGVHGYETSGVHGALKFLDSEADAFVEHFNFIVAPCVSPWGYETINRWNPIAVDPNRSFVDNSPSEEAANVMAFVKGLGVEVFAHIDLHETTDTDESEFRPALAARDGKDYEEDIVPDGFYTVGDTENPNSDFQKAIIDEVRTVTHIAPADADGNIIGSPVQQDGVINYPLASLGLCNGFTACKFGTTTEVYPDSPKVTDEECNDAQVAAIRGALKYLINLK